MSEGKEKFEDLMDTIVKSAKMDMEKNAEILAEMTKARENPPPSFKPEFRCKIELYLTAIQLMELAKLVKEWKE